MQDKTHHFPKTNALPSTKMPILCSKCPKTRVPKPKKHKNPDFVLEMPENEGSEGQKSTKMPILCSGASPMVGLIHSFNKYGRPESLYDLFWSPVWVLYSELWLPNRYHRNPLPHPAAVASSRRTAAAELRLLHGYQRSVAAATYHRTYRRTPNCC